MLGVPDTTPILGEHRDLVTKHYNQEGGETMGLLHDGRVVLHAYLRAVVSLGKTVISRGVTALSG
jgi:hypothetical protein